MRPLHRRLLGVAVGLLLAGVLAGCGGGSTTPSPPRNVALQTLIAIPNLPSPAGTGWDFDIGIVDPATATYYVSDRTNKSVDIIDARTNTLKAQVPGFVGQVPGDNSTSGPNGMAVLPGNILWATDGNSTIHVIDLATNTTSATWSTGGTKRTDVVVYDPDTGEVMITNKNEPVPFVTFWSPSNTTSSTPIAKLSIPSSGLDAALYDPGTKKYFISVTSTSANPQGEVDVVDPVSHTVTNVYPVAGCLPGGLALGPSERLLIACSGDAIAAGFHAQSYILDAASGKVLADITAVGGSDEAYYDPADQMFYTASRDMTQDGSPTSPKAPSLGVINAVSMQFVQLVATSYNSKSVAADPTTGKVFVPLTGKSSSSAAVGTASGPGVGVFNQY